MRIKANPVVVLSLLSLFSCISVVMAADRFVSPAGDDSHSGTQSAPYKTLNKALNQASPGDIIYLREGRYHEVIDFSGINGNSNNPITITAYQGEEVVIDGSRSLSELGAATWVPLTDGGHPACLNNCYKTTINPDLFTAADGATDSEDGSVVQGVWQLWVANESSDGNYKMMIPARWPNYDRSQGHPSEPIRFKSDNRTPLDNSWWDMGGTWAFMKTSWVSQKDAGYDSSVLTSKTSGYNLHHLDNNPAYHDLSDLPANDLGGNPLSFSGGSLILNYHSETQFSRNIEPDGHQAGTNRLTHRSVVDPHDQNTGYFMVEHKNALDQPGEWYYDKDSHEIWLWPEDGQDPTGSDIRGKTQSWGMDLTASRHITLRGLTFFGTAIKCEQDCTDITIEDNQFLYPSWYPRMLGLHSYKGEDQLHKGDKAGSSSGEGAIRLKGKNYLLRNNVFAHSDAMIDMNGSSGCKNDNNHFINNLFHHWSYTGSAQMMILMNSNCNSSFVRNTMHTNGSKVMLKHGSVDVAWSHVSQFGYFQQDGTAFQCKGGNFENGASNGTERHHIWAVDALKGLGRWDGNDGVGGVDHHQVAMNVAAHGNVKGDYHIVTNNTTVHPHQPSKTMFKLTSTSFMDEDKDGNPDLDENGLAMAAENAHSHLYNNASSGISSDPHIAVPLLIKPEYMAANWNGFGEVKTLPNFDPAAGSLRKGQFETRVAGDTVASRLRDPKNFDFRPKATATDLIDQGVEVAIPIIGLNNVAVPKGLGNIGDTLALNDPIAGAQPDIGAYEFDVNSVLEYWIPGYRDPTKATMAVPRNGTATAKIDADLMWLPAQNAVAHVVYLGTSENQLQEICRFEGEAAFAQGRDTESLPALENGFTHLKNICSPETLVPNQNYTWRVDTVDHAGMVTQGDVWQFGVGSPSKQVTTVLPAIEDTYIDENDKTENFANQRGMLLCTPDITSSSPNRLIYIKFDLSEIPGNITQATMRVKRSDGNGTTHDTGAYVVGNDWQDNQLTYESAQSKGLIPEEGDRELAFVEKIYEGSWGDFTITEGIESGQQILSVALKSHPSKSCGSRKLVEAIEAENNSNKALAPELVIVYEELTTSTVTAAVTDLSYTENGHSLTFDWTASLSDNAVGYNIYRRDHHEDSYQFPLNPSVLTSTQYIDTSLNAGQSYEYVVRAINSEGLESADTEIINVRLTDSDGDGMSDRWEQFYGLNPNVDDASPDSDADGVSNLDEYIGFSEPNNASVTAGSSELSGELSALSSLGTSISEVSAGDTVSLNVTNTNVSDVMPVISEWRQLSGPDINLTVSDLGASFVAPEVSTDSDVVVELVMSRGNSYLTQTQTITIAGQGTVEPPVVPPAEPTLVAGAILTVNGEQTLSLSAGDIVTLDASSSGISDGSELSFMWTYNGVVGLSINNIDSAVTTFTVPELSDDTIVTLDMTVSSGGQSESTSITATIQKVENSGGDNGTPTTPEVPSIQQPASGGGSLSYGVFVLLLLTRLARKRLITQERSY